MQKCLDDLEQFMIHKEGRRCGSNMKLNGILIMSKESIFLRELRGLFAKHNIQIISTEYDVDDERENSYRLTNHEVGEDDGIDLDVSDIMARCWVVQEYPISRPKIS